MFWIKGRMSSRDVLIIWCYLFLLFFTIFKGWGHVTWLHKAAAEGNIVDVEKNLQQTASFYGIVYFRQFVNILDEKNGGKAPLHLAIETGCWRMVEILLAAGASLNLSGVHGNTPLHLAVLKGNESMSELFLKRGAFVNAWNKKGDTPCDLALYNHDWGLCYLLERYGGKTRQDIEKEHENYKQVRYLIKRMTNGDDGGWCDIDQILRDA